MSNEAESNTPQKALKALAITFFKPSLVVALCLIGVAMIGSVISFSHKQKPAASVDAIAKKVSRYARVVSHAEVGKGGLIAWTLDKDGQQVVLYTTPDGEALISGVVWDLESSKNLTDKFGVVQSSAGQQMTLSAAPTTTETPSPSKAGINNQPKDEYILNPAEHFVSAMDGEYKGEVPESMKTVDSLKGIKEGKGSINNTVYIVFDPRCHYCRDAYTLTRELVSKGRSIKWIPTAALGQPAQATPLIATILQSKDKDVLDRIMSKHEPIASTPTPETIQAMNDNLSFMFAAFKQNSSQQAGVPVAFFLDHRTGKARMLSGVSDPAVIKDIFGSL